MRPTRSAPSSLHSFGWCVVLLLTSMQSWGQPTGCISGDCVNGQGTFTFASGDKYVGGWKGGNWHGQGTVTFADGRVEEGIFENGEFLRRR